ncbi:MAG: hypothetical protein L3J11_03060 [Draconibacterium sp.]|nr:hypothetical protein [Draconibacterium sp.]
MKNLSFIFATVLFFAGATVSNAKDNNDTSEAQHTVAITIPTIALVDVEGASGEATTINLSPDVSSLEAGEKIDFTSVSDNSLWLNYTSIISGSNNNGNGNNNSNERVITVELNDASNLPSGVEINLSTGAVSTGNGNKGEEVTGTITLSETAQNIVTGIGSCYTESGYQKGHQLTYGLSMDDASYEDLTADSYEVTITYTISE